VRIIRSANSVFRDMRHRGALGLFRLASTILRRATNRYQRRRIARGHLRVALSTARLLERSAGALLLGLRQGQDQSDRGRIDRS
jgi:hypothetical protein